MSWQKAGTWWKHGALLRATFLPKPGSLEEVYALSPGLSGSSNSHKAAVKAFYQYVPSTVDRVSYWTFVNAGGVSIEARYYSPGSAEPFIESMWTDRFVEVRGHRASLKELRRAEGDGNDWRTIWWNESLEDGATIQWEVGNHPDVYSVEQTIEVINQLKEVD